MPSILFGIPIELVRVDGRIAGKVCVVTGAGSGIGRASAVRLAEEGGRVLCADLDLTTVSETVELIHAAGGAAFARQTDVSDSRAVDAMIADAVDRFDGLDVLVNNAGVNIPGVLHEVTDEVIDGGKEFRDRMIARNNQELTRQEIALVVVLLASVIVGGFVSLFISRGIEKPIIGIAATINHMAQGEFNLTMPHLGRKDEIGDIAEPICSAQSAR